MSTAFAISVAAASLGLWPLYWDVSDEGVARTLQAYLLAVILPALFASLLTQEQRATNAARLIAMQALQAVMDAVPNAIMTLTQGGKSQTIQGRAGYQEQILSLAQEEGPPLVGKVAVDPVGKRFTFKPPGTGAERRAGGLVRRPTPKQAPPLPQASWLL